MDEVNTSQYFSNHKQVRKPRKKPTGEEIERETALLECASQLFHDTPAVGDTAPCSLHGSWSDHSQSPFSLSDNPAKLLPTFDLTTTNATAGYRRPEVTHIVWWLISGVMPWNFFFYFLKFFLGAQTGRLLPISSEKMGSGDFIWVTFCSVSSYPESPLRYKFKILPIYLWQLLDYGRVAIYSRQLAGALGT